jgi:hypothetical protein
MWFEALQIFSNIPEISSYVAYLAASSAVLVTPFSRFETLNEGRITFGVVALNAGSSGVMKFVMPSCDTRQAGFLTCYQRANVERNTEIDSRRLIGCIQYICCSLVVRDKH